MDKNLSSKPIFAIFLLIGLVKLNGGRKVTGTLRGYDQFMNLVLDNTIEEVSANERNDIGMVVHKIDHFAFLKLF